MADGNAKPVKTGRPLKVNDFIVEKLEEAFRLGCTIETACNHAEIDKKTYYAQCERDPSFLHRMNKARDYARLAAGSVVMQAIIKDKDVQTARWWLEKKHPGEFSSSPQVAIQNNNAESVTIAWNDGSRP